MRQLQKAPAAEASAGALAAFVRSPRRKGMRLRILSVVAQAAPGEGLPSREVAAWEIAGEEAERKAPP